MLVLGASNWEVTSQASWDSMDFALVVSERSSTNTKDEESILQAADFETDSVSSHLHCLQKHNDYFLIRLL